MPVRIDIDTLKIAGKIDSAWRRGLPQLASIIRENCNEFCKKDNGYLIASSLIHSDLSHGRLVWQTPYAARQYYEIRTANREVNPNASWRWCEVARTVYHERWNRQAQAIKRYYG